MTYLISVYFACHKKLGKRCNFLICFSHFLSLKKFPIANNSGYIFCGLDILWCKSEHKKVKIRLSRKLPDIQYWEYILLCLQWSTSSWLHVQDQFFKVLACRWYVHLHVYWSICTVLGGSDVKYISVNNS